MILIVSENWTGAIKIYEKNGFETVKIIPNFFQFINPEKYFENGLVMRKKID